MTSFWNGVTLHISVKNGSSCEEARNKTGVFFLLKRDIETGHFGSSYFIFNKLLDSARVLFAHWFLSPSFFSSESPILDFKNISSQILTAEIYSRAQNDTRQRKKNSIRRVSSAAKSKFVNLITSHFIDIFLFDLALFLLKFALVRALSLETSSSLIKTLPRFHTKRIPTFREKSFLENKLCAPTTQYDDYRSWCEQHTHST